jgi:hypothetical protein
MVQGKFPNKMHMGQAALFTIEHGIRPCKLINKTALPKLLAFVLPPFQRGEVWTALQKSKFIESLWLGLPVSVYAYNQSPSLGETDQWLIDGQQRWTAIRDFVDNKIRVFGGLQYRDMSEVEDRHFRCIGFPCILLKSDDKGHLEEMYNRLAYGGTPHEVKV